MRHIWTLIVAGLLSSAALVSQACSASMPAAPTPEAAPIVASTPAPPSVPVPAAATTARYQVTFESIWSADSHPQDFPGIQSHFSPLIGAVHGPSVSFWRDGALATPGIQDMAERGLTTRLTDEVTAAITAGTARSVITGGFLAATPGSVSLEFEISQSHPLVTLVTMVAPSPDWFVGVSGLRLFEGGSWVGTRRVDLIAWDAGTDSGSTFRSPDVPTTPHQPIAPIVTAPLSPGGSVTTLGTFTFTRIGF